MFLLLHSLTFGELLTYIHIIIYVFISSHNIYAYFLGIYEHIFFICKKSFTLVHLFKCEIICFIKTLTLFPVYMVSFFPKSCNFCLNDIF